MIAVHHFRLDFCTRDDLGLTAIMYAKARVGDEVQVCFEDHNGSV